MKGGSIGVNLATVPRERVRWLWDRRIPFGKLTIVEGDPDDAGAPRLLALRLRRWLGDTTLARQVRCGVDLALHDLAGRALGVPVSELLGGAARSTLRVAYAIGSHRIDCDQDNIRRFRQRLRRKRQSAEGDKSASQRRTDQPDTSHVAPTWEASSGQRIAV